MLYGPLPSEKRAAMSHDRGRPGRHNFKMETEMKELAVRLASAWELAARLQGQSYFIALFTIERTSCVDDRT